jgi:hypothetical protein
VEFGKGIKRGEGKGKTTLIWNLEEECRWREKKGI